jgi:uncharacterized Zn finger protein
VRAVEEASYADSDLHAARALSRSGGIGAITVDAGTLTARVHHRADAWPVSATVPELDPVSRRSVVEVVAGESGHLGALMAGELPHRLVEQAEEAGVELLPYGGELGSDCPCGAWVDPCVHALALMLQVAWLVDGDPWVLLRLRGLSPDELHAELAATPPQEAGGSSDQPSDEVSDEPSEVVSDELAVAMDAAARAARVVALADDPAAEISHLL